MLCLVVLLPRAETCAIYRRSVARFRAVNIELRRFGRVPEGGKDGGYIPPMGSAHTLDDMTVIARVNLQFSDNNTMYTF